MTAEELTMLEPEGLCRILHIPILKAYLGLEIRDDKGKVLYRHKQEARSWNRNFYNMLFTQGAAVAGNVARSLQIVGTGGTTYESDHSAHSPATTYGSTNYGLYCEYPLYRGGFDAGIGTDTYGIVVGTGTNPEQFDYGVAEGYRLQTKIAHGNGAGQLSYQESSPITVSTIGTTKRAIHEF